MGISAYFPLLVMLIIAIVMAVAILVLSYLISPRFKNRIKDSVYESGIPTQTDARLRFPIRFYVVAMMFILFDVEVIFMYPWAVVYKQFLSGGLFILIEMLVFIGILFIGYIYLYKSDAFKWE